MTVHKQKKIRMVSPRPACRPVVEVEDGDFDIVQAELEADEVRVPKLDEQKIVKKYETKQARIIIQRNDFLIPSIIDMANKQEMLDVTPKYQRRPRWTQIKKSHLIESLLINIPIPPIFLYEREYAKYEVMDGQQRLNAICDFFNDKFELVNLQKWPELNECKYSDLPKAIQAGLQRRSLPAVIILTESGQSRTDAEAIKRYVFERLNTGGEILNAQEVRNCIFASKFNDALIEISRSENFTRVWGIPPKEPDEPRNITEKLKKNSLYSKMYDCEIVLRYFAFSDLSKFSGGVKNTLDEFMEKMRKATRDECQNLVNEYKTMLERAEKIYGTALFRLPKKGALCGRLSVPLSDAVLIAIRKIGHGYKQLISHKDKVLGQTFALMVNPESETYEALVGRGNTKAAIERRILIISNMFENIVKTK